MRGAPCVLGQLSGGPGPGKPPPDRALPHHGLLLPRGLFERVPASTRREETGVLGTRRVWRRWSEPSPPPRLHPQGHSPHTSHGCWAGCTAVSVGGCPQDCTGTAGGRDGADRQGTYGRSRGAWGPLRPQQTSRPLQERRAETVRLGPESRPPPTAPLCPPIPDVSAARGVWPTPLPACFLCSPHPSSRPRPWGPGARGGQDWSGLSPHPRLDGRCPTPSGGHCLPSWPLPPHTSRRLISRALHSDRTFSDAAQETTVPTSVAT